MRVRRMGARQRIPALRHKYRRWWPVFAGFMFISGVLVTGVAG